MSDLTQEETRWLKRVQKVLNECPSDRLGFFTIGDPEISVYDYTQEDEIERLLDSGMASDFCVAVNNLDANLGSLHFPKHVHSTAG